MNRTKAHVYRDQNDRIQVSISYKPLQIIYPDSNNHHSLNILNFVDRREYEFTSIEYDKQARARMLRRLENTGLISRIAWGVYYITGYGMRAKEHLDQGIIWENELYIKQMNHLTRSQRTRNR